MNKTEKKAKKLIRHFRERCAHFAALIQQCDEEGIAEIHHALLNLRRQAHEACVYLPIEVRDEVAAILGPLYDAFNARIGHEPVPEDDEPIIYLANGHYIHTILHASAGEHSPDFLACLSKSGPDRPWVFKFRFRYDSGSGDPFDDSDFRSRYTAIIEGSEGLTPDEAYKQLMELIAQLKERLAEEGISDWREITLKRDGNHPSCAVVMAGEDWFHFPPGLDLARWVDRPEEINDEPPKPSSLKAGNLDCLLEIPKCLQSFIRTQSPDPDTSGSTSSPGSTGTQPAVSSPERRGGNRENARNGSKNGSGRSPGPTNTAKT